MHSAPLIEYKHMHFVNTAYSAPLTFAPLDISSACETDEHFFCSVDRKETCAFCEHCLICSAELCSINPAAKACAI